MRTILILLLLTTPCYAGIQGVSSPINAEKRQANFYKKAIRIIRRYHKALPDEKIRELRDQLSRVDEYYNRYTWSIVEDHLKAGRNLEAIEEIRKISSPLGSGVRVSSKPVK